MNDASESDIGLDTIRSIVRTGAVVEKDNIKRAFYRELKKVLISRANEKSFIFSLSDREDDLSQWRSYANEGEGFTIGFKTSTLLKLSNKPGSSFSFGKVSYNSHLNEKRMKHALNEFESLYLSLPDRELESTRLYACYNLDACVSSLAAIYKHSSFRSEREWRISTFAQLPEGVEIRVSGKRLVPYMEVVLEDKDTLFPIARVGIGPGFRDPAIRFAVERLCKMNKIEVDIYSADTPFRRN